VKSSLALLIVLSVGSAGLAAPEPSQFKRHDPRKEQEEAVRLILRLGGKVLYDYQQVKGGKPYVFDPKASPKNSKAFHRVVSVDLAHSKVCDEDLKLIGKLPFLEILVLTGTRITNAGLAHLKGLTKLRCLWLWNTRIDDQGLRHLKGMTKLWQLLLDGTKVTDAGLAHLKGLVELEEWLGLSDTLVTDQGLKHLEGLTKLQSLTLMRTKVTEEGVKKLRAALPKTHVSLKR
jgi:hypothetical protein